MKSLNVMNLDFNLLAILNGYNSIVLTRVWNEMGTMHIEINSEVTNASLITLNTIVWLGKDFDRVYIVERIEEVFENGIIVRKIDCLAIESLLRDYITIPPTGDERDTITGTREQIVRGWVDNNTINPEDANRVQYEIALGTYNGYGTTITEGSRYKNLAEEIKRVLLPESLSWKLILDVLNSTFVFNVYEAVDKSYGSLTPESKILFGSEYGNISTYTRVVDNLSEKTYVYAGGQGEGIARTIVEVAATGDRRKELFVDARDISDTGELQERALQNLSDNQVIDNFEFEVIERQYTYGTDYDLGDIVTIVIDKNTYYDKQIIKITEIHERNKIQVIPEFGSTTQGLSDKLKKFVSRLSVVETV